MLLSPIIIRLIHRGFRFSLSVLAFALWEYIIVNAPYLSSVHLVKLPFHKRLQVSILISGYCVYSVMVAYKLF